jgi:asparagine synthetase B (glutamine-hydrolysing)
LDVFASSAGRITHLDAATGRAVYVVGRAYHPSVSDESIPQWCAQTLDADPSAFRSLLGAFVLVIDDRRSKWVTFVTDPLGLLPWFVGSSGGRLVAGSDVLGICDAGLSSGEVDVDSVASWLCYSFVAAGGSVVRDYRRLPGGTISTFERDGRLGSETRYATLKYVQNVVRP